MSHTLMAILGTMVVDGDLRGSLVKSGRDERLRRLRDYGFFLTRAEHEAFEKMMRTFESGELEEACGRVAVLLPRLAVQLLQVRLKTRGEAGPRARPPAAAGHAAFDACRRRTPAAIASPAATNGNARPTSDSSAFV